jgi:hypothetical protein
MRNRRRLRLADEIRSIHRRAAARDGRVVTADQLVLFSTETGDAWLLDPSDCLAARLARDGDPEPSPSRKPTPASKSTGPEAIASTDRPSSTPIVEAAAYRPSSVIRRTSLQASEISNIFG